MKIHLFYLMIFTFLGMSNIETLNIDVDDLCDLEGYTLYDCTETGSNFDGEIDEITELDNGWIVKITNTYGSDSFSSYEDAALFINQYEYGGRSYNSLKMIVGDMIFDLEKIK